MSVRGLICDRMLISEFCTARLQRDRSDLSTGLPTADYAKIGCLCQSGRGSGREEPGPSVCTFLKYLKVSNGCI